MTTPIRTLHELVDELQDLIDSTGKHVYAEDLQDVLDRVVLAQPPSADASDPHVGRTGKPTTRDP
jgi:hypothetical protein